MAGVNQVFPGILSTPEYAGNVYDIQTKQALAQALMQKGLQGNLQAYQPAGGGFSYVPRMGLAGALLGSTLPTLLGGEMQRQANQELTALGQQQQAALTRMLTPQTITEQIGGGGVAPPNVKGPAGAQTSGQDLGNALAQPQTVTRTVSAPLNPGNLDPNVARYLMNTAPEKYLENVLSYNKPADIISKIKAAGIDPNSPLGQQLAQTNLAKENFIAPLAGGPGTVYRNPTNPTQVLANNPMIETGQEVLGYTPEGRPIVASMLGAAQSQEQLAAAKAKGGAAVESETAFVQNPQTGQWQEIRQPKGTANAAFNAAGATTPFQQATVQAESGGNPNAVSPKGAMGAWQVMPNTNANPGFGVTPARDNSRAELDRVGRDYSNAMLNKYGGNQQLAAIAYNMGPGATDAWMKKGAKWEDLPPETKNYMGKVSFLTSMNQPQQTVPQAPAPRGSTFAAPPLGAQAEAEASARGAQNTMDKSYEGLQQARSSGQNSLTLLNDMQQYATSKNPALANKLYNVQGIFSPDAQLFDKARSNLISQVAGSTGMGTDQARAIVEGSIPSFGMSQTAIQKGLEDIKGQVQLRMLKSDYMSDAYAQKNAQQYNLRENQFDQMMTPTAANIVKMPAGPARNNAIQAARQNPTDENALRWALQTGLLK